MPSNKGVPCHAMPCPTFLVLVEVALVVITPAHGQQLGLEEACKVYKVGWAWTDEQQVVDA